MQLYVLNHNREQIGVLESFEYLLWNRKYSAYGYFELKALATPDTVGLLALDYYLRKSDDEEIAIIEHLELSQENRETITVSGRFATSFLARRVIPGIETLNSGISEAVGQLINNHLINPADPARTIPFITYTDTGLADLVATQVERQNLYDAVSALCEATDVGIKTAFNTTTKALTISLYKGSPAPAVFAEEFENLLTQHYTQSIVDYANVAVVAGESAQITVGTVSGASRQEVFVDASSLKASELGSDYELALGFEGQAKLDELTLVRSFEVTINPHANLTYKTDYDLGDIVTVVSKKWGVTLTVRIVEVAETYDLQGQNLEITFGKGILTLAQKLKGGR